MEALSSPEEVFVRVDEPCAERKADILEKDAASAYTTMNKDSLMLSERALQATVSAPTYREIEYKLGVSAACMEGLDVTLESQLDDEVFALEGDTVFFSVAEAGRNTVVSKKEAIVAEEAIVNEFTNPSDMDDECNPGNKLEARGGMSVMAIGALKQYEVDMAKVVHSKSKVRLPSTPITLGFYFPLLYSHHMHIASNTTPRPS